MARRRTTRFTPEERAALVARVEDLELRVRLLEARVRATAVQARREAPETLGRKARPERPHRRRPRCPGCTLELPPGRRGENCVWCGFRFDAVTGLLR